MDPPEACPPAYDLHACPWLDLESPLTAYEVLKLVLLWPLAVVRALWMLVTWLIVGCMSWLICLGVPDDVPLPPLRYAVMSSTVHVMNRLCLFVCGYYWIKVTGWDNLREARRAQALMVINHSAYFDMPALFYVVTCSAVAMSAVQNMPLIGPTARAMRFLFVDRKTAAGAMEQSKKGAAAANGNNTQRIQQRTLDTRFPPLWIAPEGTTTNGKQLIMFKTGAFATGRPVQPVLLRFPFRHLNPAYTNCDGLWHFFRHMTQLVNWAEVTVLSVYTPSAAELADSALYMSNVRTLMARELGVPLVEQGLEELHALNKARVQVAWDGRTVLGDVDSLPQLIAEARQKRMDKEAAEASRAEEGRAAASMAVASVDHTSSEEAPNKKLLPTSSSITPASSSDYNTF